jgi:hypothetical protein
MSPVCLHVEPQIKNLVLVMTKKLNGDIKLSNIYRAWFKGNTCSMLYVDNWTVILLTVLVTSTTSPQKLNHQETFLWYQRHHTLSLVSRTRCVGVFATSSKRKKNLKIVQYFETNEHNYKGKGIEKRFVKSRDSVPLQNHSLEKKS